jgi:hypothetical protein
MSLEHIDGDSVNTLENYADFKCKIQHFEKILGATTLNGVEKFDVQLGIDLLKLESPDYADTYFYEEREDYLQGLPHTD